MGVWVDDLSSTEGHCFVRLTDEHGVTVGIGEKRDRAQRGAVLVIELARRVDEAHGGFPTIDDCYALKFLLHKHSSQLLVTLNRVAFVTPP
jgi:hypothetical protein